MEKLKDISIKELSTSIGIKSKGDKGNYECFGSEHKNQLIRPSLSVNELKGFYCFKACGVKGSNAIDLYMQFHNCDFLEACNQLSRTYNIPTLVNNKIVKPKSPKYEDLLKLENQLKYSDNFINDKALDSRKAKLILQSRGISGDSLKQMKVGLINSFFVSRIERYNKEHGTNHNTNLSVLSFPMYDEDYKFIGLKIRFFPADLEKLPKDLYLPKSMSIKGGNNGLLYDPETIKESKEIYLAEGEIDGLSLIELGYKNIVINLGGVSSCMKMIKNLCKDKTIICLYDNDKAGNEASVKLSQVLNRKIRRVNLPIADGAKSVDINNKISEGWSKDDFDKAIKKFEYIGPDKVEYSEDDQFNDADDDKSASKADKILKLILDSKDIKLFHNEINETYAQIKLKGVFQIYLCKSRQFEIYLSSLFWNKYKTTVRSDDVRNALAVIESEALHNGEECKLSNRIAGAGNSIYYDLADKKNGCIEINQNGWKLSEEGLILFRRYNHQKAQAMPMTTGGDINKVFNYLNFKHKEHELLFLVYLVSLFIPSIPHPIIVFYGSKGASKSTSSKIIRKIVDPSILELVSLPTSNNELTQVLDHNWIIPFDNLSKISQIQADTLCRSVTGEGFSKRALFTDNDDVIYSFKRCIIMNGINLSSTKSDLLDRSLIFELDKIDKDKRKSERTIWKDFKKDLPIILGGIFDSLVKTLAIYPTIKLKVLPRMADFAEWGCAIAKSIGIKIEDFLSAYDNNIQEQNYEVVQDDIVASTIIAFMKNKTEWQGTPSQLLKEFDQILFVMNKTAPASFPKTAQALSRSISGVSSNLSDIGILTDKGKNSDGNRYIKFYKQENIASNASKTQEASVEAVKLIDETVDAKIIASTDATGEKELKDSNKLTLDAIDDKNTHLNKGRFKKQEKNAGEITLDEKSKLAEEVFNGM